VTEQFNPHDDIRGGAYRAVLDFARAQGVADALLVVRDGVHLDPSGEAVLARLEPYLRERRKARSWPGTQLGGRGHNATVSRYRLNKEVVGILVEAADGLFDWTHLQLPEDLCLLRSSGSPWLTTIAHEYEAWFDLTPAESERMRQTIPDLVPPVRSRSDEIARRKRRRKRR
jgi:hypothetical protein